MLYNKSCNTWKILSGYTLVSISPSPAHPLYFIYFFFLAFQNFVAVKKIFFKFFLLILIILLYFLNILIEYFENKYYISLEYIEINFPAKPELKINNLSRQNMPPPPRFKWLSTLLGPVHYNPRLVPLSLPARHNELPPPIFLPMDYSRHTVDRGRVVNMDVILRRSGCLTA